MDTELMMIQMEQDFNELAEQYDGAAENESIWASGAKTREMIEMHLQNAAQNREMAKFYRYLAGRALDLVESFEEA